MRPSKRDELVRKALVVFYNHGFHAAGMDLVAAETGISKTSIYKHFRTKEELILATLRLRDENFRNWLMRRTATLAGSPYEQLLAIFDAHGEWFALPEFCGCMFIKASAEFQDPSHPIHEQSAQHQRLLLDFQGKLARDAGFTDPDCVAHKIWILTQGAIVAAVMRVRENPAIEARSMAEIVLASAPRA